MTDRSEVYLGVDLGASSGRVLAGRFDGDRLFLDEVNRFDNGPTVANDRYYWDVLRLWQHIQTGLRSAAEQFGDSIRSVGIDTWGVDYCLLGPGDELLGNPYHYRDPRTSGGLQRAFEVLDRDAIFEESGLQFMELNTLYQLLATQSNNAALLDAAESFLMIPDFFHWLLTGEKANELTNASTTQLYNPRAGQWSQKLLDAFGLPSRIFCDIVPAGTRLGRIRNSLAAETRLAGTDVVLPGTHDTASAVAAVPTSASPSGALDWCYISSGTWSLMGVESPSPIVNARCRELNFTNEGGVSDTTRILKNIAGLWLIQECRRIWQHAGQAYSWEALVEIAKEAPRLRSLIDPDVAEFVSPSDMPAQIRSFCARTKQPVPDSDGAVVRTVLESLALRYRTVLQWLEELTGSQLATIHIVGGGTRNRLLCQMAADACNRTVLSGPVEATAIGNVMMQAVAGGRVGSISESRQIIRSSFDVQRYVPEDPDPWNEAFERFERLGQTSSDRVT